MDVAYALAPALLGLAALTAARSAADRHTLRRDVSGMLAPLLPDLAALAALAVVRGRWDWTAGPSGCWPRRCWR